MQEAGRTFREQRESPQFLALPLVPLLQLLGSCHLKVDTEMEVRHEGLNKRRHPKLSTLRDFQIS